MPLPSFALTGNLKEVFGDVSSDELVESTMDRAVIEFTANVPADSYIKWENSIYRQPPVPARVDSDGYVVNPTGGPVLLLAQDDGLNIRGLQWRVYIALTATAIPSRSSAKMRTFWFNALTDGESIDLKDVLPTIQQEVHDAPSGGTVTGDIDGGTPTSTGSSNIDGGTP